ncbi:hypothetical protein [Dyadobacter pollutisoli]|uniref:DUF3300 domain-containing protein n=1 Tax=Dyadobacter pollutisoli TaxID=2910158 RepID=A0A9E8N676_9BACT|nr:hypothetical protein [Dyadobacter pollutisoli]WAC09307.1 hypothetical protein ON006_16265 [Dyadobacter pollutisoli]
MKNLASFIIMIACMLSGLNAKAQAEEEKLDLPGDNLNLYAVLKLFQESETLEGFERKLNDEETEINNLDLDGDDNIDYIRVSDDADGNLHTITLKVAVSDREDQDVAVFFVEKKEDGQVLIQLIGDEDLYGKDYIIEPNALSDNGETPNPGYNGNKERRDEPVEVRDNTTYVIASWPLVRYIYVPNYVIWHSPWRWHYYPSYWHPWRPRYWHAYYGYHYHWHYYYNGHFRRWNQYRNPVWYNHYYGGGYRSRSVVVRTRYTRGDYRNTYSRPSSARDGSDLFVRRNPKAPTVKERLPSFDKTGRPVVSRPVPSRLGTSRPETSRPGTSRPSVTRPGNGNENARPGTSRPSVTRPGTSRPEVSRPETQRPVTRPVRPRPAPKPEPQRPVTRPAPSRPAPSARPESRPATRPSSRERG